MNDMKMRIIESLLGYLEELDAEDLQGQMPKPEMEAVVAVDDAEAMPEEGMEKGPMDELAGTEPMSEEDMDEDELEELSKLSM